MARVTRPPEERRQELINAATHLFSAKGVDATSVSDIVKSIGVAQGTFYWYFKSKTEILNAVIQEYAEGVCQEIAGLQEQNLPALVKFNAIQAKMLSLLNHREQLEHFHKPENQHFHDQMSKGIILKLIPVLARIIAQGVEEGVFSVSSPERAAAFVLGASLGIPDGSEVFSQGETEIWVKDLVAFVLKGLGYQNK